MPGLNQSLHVQSAHIPRLAYGYTTFTDNRHSTRQQATKSASICTNRTTLALHVVHYPIRHVNPAPWDHSHIPDPMVDLVLSTRHTSICHAAYAHELAGPR